MQMDDRRDQGFVVQRDEEALQILGRLEVYIVAAVPGHGAQDGVAKSRRGVSDCGDQEPLCDLL